MMPVATERYLLGKDVKERLRQGGNLNKSTIQNDLNSGQTYHQI